MLFEFNIEINILDIYRYTYVGRVSKGWGGEKERGAFGFDQEGTSHKDV